MGTAHAIKGFMQAYNWDYVTRAVKINSIPGQIKVHEFYFKGRRKTAGLQDGSLRRESCS